MADQTLLTIFLAVLSLAVAIQAGILIGIFVLTSRLSRQADRAARETQRLFDPMRRVAETLQTLSSRLTEFGAAAQGRVREFGARVERAHDSWHDR